MTVDEAKHTIHKIEKLMDGHNFNVTLGIEHFNDCYKYDDFANKLTMVFKESKPYEKSPYRITILEFWQELRTCLDYRGDEAAGLVLSSRNAVKLQDEQDKYFDYIKEFLAQESKLFVYPDEKGSPGYPVYWDFRFLILSGKGKALFIYGSSSD